MDINSMLSKKRISCKHKYIHNIYKWIFVAWPHSTCNSCIWIAHHPQFLFTSDSVARLLQYHWVAICVLVRQAGLSACILISLHLECVTIKENNVFFSCFFWGGRAWHTKKFTYLGLIGVSVSYIQITTASTQLVWTVNQSSQTSWMKLPLRSQANGELWAYDWAWTRVYWRELPVSAQEIPTSVILMSSVGGRIKIQQLTPTPGQQ